MAPSRSSRKRQTRLNFSPAASSSPLRSEAYVRIDGRSTPSKRRRISPADSSRNLSRHHYSSTSNSGSQVKLVVPSPPSKGHALPTPAASSQLDQGYHVKAEEQSEGESEDEDEVIPTSSRRSRGYKATRPQDSNSAPRTRREETHNRAISLSSESEDLELQIADVTPKTTPQSKMTTPPNSRRANGKTFILGAKSGTAAIPYRRASRTFRDSKKSAQKYGGTSSSSEFEANVVGLRKAGKPTSRRNARTGNGRIAPDPLDMLESSEPENDDLVTPIMNSLSTPAKRLKRNSAIALSDEEVRSSHSTSASPVAPSRRRKTQRLESEVSKSPDVVAELDEDLADLRSSDVETRETRTRGRPQASERNKRLDRLQELKRRRSGLVHLSSDSEDHRSSFSGSIDQESEVELHVDNLVSENMDEYEDDFIHDDDDDAIGVDLSKSGVPLALTQFARLKPFEYFKYEVEWMIHNKLDPAFERHDEVYRVSHQKLDDEFIGHAGSTYKSSIWTPDFIDALMSRPDFSVLQVPTMFEEKCNACNRSGHPPKFKVTFSGKKYDKHSLEPISNEQSDQDSVDDDEENNEDDEQEYQDFHLGSHCYANAEIAHTLYHWRYHLNDLILHWLEDEGHLKAKKIVEREKWNRKKKEKLANRIVDGMVEGGQMKELYRSFKDSLEAARTAKPERFYDDRGL